MKIIVEMDKGLHTLFPAYRVNVGCYVRSGHSVSAIASGKLVLLRIPSVLFPLPPFPQACTVHQAVSQSTSVPYLIQILHIFHLK